MAVMNSPANLKFQDGTRLELHGSATLGRSSSESTIVLRDELVSRKHALVQCQGDGDFWLVDLGSSNGTYVNGARLDRPRLLNNADAIKLGDTELIFEFDGDICEKHRTLAVSTQLSLQRRKCWLIIADLIGSTARSQQVAPEVTARENGQWFKQCRELIDTHGGQMNQYLGDGFLAFWESSDSAPSQLREMLSDIHHHQSQQSPAFRFVLHFGLTVIGGVPTLSSLNLHGAAVNFAFRMEKLAGALGVGALLSEAAGQELGLTPMKVHEAELAGFSGSHRFWQIASTLRDA